MNRLKYMEIVEIPKSKPIIIYKKLDENMKSPYHEFQYEMGKTYKVKFNNSLYAECCTERLYSIPLEQINKWDGIRLFKVAVWGKCILENHKIGSEYLKILNEEDVSKYKISSKWACEYCLNYKNKKEVRNKISCSDLAYFYYRDIEKIKKKYEMNPYGYTIII